MLTESNRSHPPAIIVPIHGGADLVKRLFVSLGKTVPKGTTVVMINDASEDQRIDDLLLPPSLDMLLHGCDVHVLRNTENLGFAGSVNRGIMAAADADVIIVNSDVELPDGWYAAMTRAAESCDHLATLSCLADNGAMLSVPERNSSSSFPTDASLADAAASIGECVDPSPVEICNAVGHVMFISRTAIDAVGFFDEEFYPGYGEEVDFSLRASEAGFRHWVAPTVVVRHESGGSFGAARENLVRRHSALVERRYPYVWARAEFFENQTTHPLAGALLRASTALRRPRVRLLGAIDAAHVNLTDELRRHFELVPTATKRVSHRSCDVDIVLITRSTPRLRCDQISERLIVIIERVDLITSPWLHDSTEHWLQWLDRVRDICAVADRVITTKPKILAQWFALDSQRLEAIQSIETTLGIHSDSNSAEARALLGPVSSDVFLQLADEEASSRPAGSRPIIAEIIPEILTVATSEPTAFDGRSRSRYPAFAGRLPSESLHSRISLADEAKNEAIPVAIWDPSRTARLGDTQFLAGVLDMTSISAARESAVASVVAAVEHVICTSPNPANVFADELCDNDTRPSHVAAKRKRHARSAAPYVTLSMRLRRWSPALGRLLGDPGNRRYLFARSVYRTVRRY